MSHETTHAPRKSRPTDAEIEARRAAHHAERTTAAAVEASRKADAKQYIAENGVQVKHFRMSVAIEGDIVGTNQFGGITVAFRRAGNYLHIATAACSDTDNYNGKIGTTVAVERMAAGQAIIVPLTEFEPHEVVELMFRDLVTVDLPDDLFPHVGIVHVGMVPNFNIGDSAALGEIIRRMTA